MILDFEIFENFFEKIRRECPKDFTILPGIRLPKSYEQLKRLRDKFGIAVPGDLLQKMKNANGDKVVEEEIGYEWGVEFIRKTQNLGLRGVHFFVMGNPSSVIRLRADSRIEQVLT